MHEIHSPLEQSMRVLRVKGMIPRYKELADEAAAQNLPYLDYLTLLFSEEAQRKEESSFKARIGKARFPYLKTLEAFDFSFQPSLNPKEILQLASLRFIEEKGNLLFLGPPGVGKTHLAVALGIKACKAGYRVLFVTAQKLLEELTIAQKDGSLMSRLLAYSRLHLQNS